MQQDPDAIGYWLVRYRDGELCERSFHTTRNLEYGNAKDGREYFYLRTINHVNVIRADLARQVPFKDVTIGEDADYAVRLFPLIRSEVFIDKTLYHYYWRTDKKRRGEKVHRDIEPFIASKRVSVKQMVDAIRTWQNV
jgi:hypothetical protein